MGKIDRMTKKHKITFAVIIFILLSTLLYTTSSYFDYRTHHPPTTYIEKHDCNIEGLVFHWSLDESNNKTIPDLSGSTHNGTIQNYFNADNLSDIFNSNPKTVAGKIDNALQFDGRQWISGGNRSCYNVDKFSISLWVYLEDNSIEMPTIVAKSSWWGKKDAFDGWWLCTTTDSQILQMGISWGNGTTHIDSGYHLPLKEWHHITITMDNIKHETIFYIDGKQYGKPHKNVHKWLPNWNHDLFVAGYDGSGRWSWPGKLDNIKFYSNILTADEVLIDFRTF